MSYKAKIIIFVLAIVLLLPLVATVILNQTDIKHSIESYIQSKTGRVFTIEGRLDAKWGRSAIVQAHQVKFANSPFARTPFAFSADKVTVSLSVVALLRGELEITAIELDKPQLWIEWLSETKRYNLDLRKSGKISKRRRLLPDWLAIKKFIIRNGEVMYFHKNRDWEFVIDQAMVESMGNNLPTRIEGVGEIEKTIVSMSGELGNLESLLRFQESPVTLNGYVGARSNQVSISGVIQNVFRWYGLNLWVDAQVSNLADLSDLFGFWLPPYRNISAKWELVQPKTARTMRLESLYLESSEHGLQAYAEGEIGQFIGFNEVDIRFNAKGNLDKTVIWAKSARGIAPEVALETSIAGSVFGNRKDLTLNLEQAEINARGININATGAVTNVLYDWSAPLPLNIEIESLEALIRDFDMPEGGVRWPVTKAINVTANLNRHKSSFALQDIKISSASESLNLKASGEINELGSGYHGELVFDVVANRLGLEQITTSEFMALLNEASVRGIVSLQDSATKLAQVKIQGRGDGINLSGMGAVGNLAQFQDVQMELQLAVTSLAKLESLVKQKLPHTGPVDMVGVLTRDAKGKFNLNAMTATLNDPDLTIAVDGEILALGAIPTINLNIDMSLETVAPIEQIYPKNPLSGLLSVLLPVRGNAQLSGPGDGPVDGYSLRAINVATQADKFSGQLHGRIDNLFAKSASKTSLQTNDLVGKAAKILPERVANQALSGKLSLELAGVADNELMADVSALKQFLLFGTLSASMDIIFSDRDVGLENIDFNINSAQTRLNASGAVRRLVPLQFDKIAVQFDVDSLAAIVRNTRLPLVWDNPAQGLIGFSNSGDGALNIVLDIEVAESDISGEIDFIEAEAGDTAEINRSYRVDLGSKNLDLTKILVATDESDRLFSRTPLKLDWLMNNQTAIEINFNADHFKSSYFTLDNFTSATTIDDAVLRTNLNGDSHQGSIGLNLVLSQDTQPTQPSEDGEQAPQWSANLDVNGEGVDFSALTFLEKSASDNAGIFSVGIDLAGIGRSTAEIVGHANGAFLLELRGAKIKNDGLQLIGGDLFFGLLTAINPLIKQRSYLDIECGVIQFDVNQGIARTEGGLALKTSKVTFIGGGEVNLGDESMKLDVVSKARTGLGVNVNTVVKVIQVGGTIKNPRIETNKKGLLQSVFALGAAVASGGLSLVVQGLYDKTIANSDVCTTRG